MPKRSETDVHTNRPLPEDARSDTPTKPTRPVVVDLPTVLGTLRPKKARPIPLTARPSDDASED
jgi:hypothetical protein